MEILSNDVLGVTVQLCLGWGGVDCGSQSEFSGGNWGVMVSPYEP